MKFWQSAYCKLILLLIIIGITLPLIFSAFHLGRSWRVGILFLGVNVITSASLGIWIQRTQQPWWVFTFFPGIFLVIVLIHYLTSIYAYFFVVLYFLIEYLAFILMKSSHEEL